MSTPPEKLEHQLEEKVKKAVQTRAEKRKAFLVANQKAASAGSAISAVGHDTLLATFEATEKAVDVAFRKRKPITFRMAPFYSGWVEARFA